MLHSVCTDEPTGKSCFGDSNFNPPKRRAPAAARVQPPALASDVLTDGDTPAAHAVSSGHKASDGSPTAIKGHKASKKVVRISDHHSKDDPATGASASTIEDDSELQAFRATFFDPRVRWEAIEDSDVSEESYVAPVMGHHACELP